MHIKGDYLTNLFLTPDRESPETGINNLLRQGDTITGYVEKVGENGLTRLLVKGRVLEALSEVPLSPGQKLSLHVSEVRPGYVRLKALVPELEAGQGQSKLLEALQELNIKPDERTVALAARLIESGLPVTRENLLKMFSITRLLGQSDARAEDIGLWLVSKNIELLPEQVLALRSFLGGANNVGRLLTEADEALKAIASTGRRANAEPAAGFSQSTDSSRSDYSEPVLNRGRPTVEAFRQENFGGEVSLPSDRRLPDFVSVTLPVFRDAIARLLDAVAVKMNEGVAPLPGDVAEVVSNLPDAGRALAVLESVLLEHSGNYEDSRVLQEVLDKITAARREVEGQQVFNVLTNQRQDNQQFVLYVALPVLVGQEFHLCELKVKREGRPKERAGEQGGTFSLALSLTTSNLGMLLFHLTCYPDRRLWLQAVSENQDVGDYLESEFPELVRELEVLGFNIEKWGVKVVEGQQRDLKSDLIELERRPARLGIDIVI